MPNACLTASLLFALASQASNPEFVVAISDGAARDPAWSAVAAALVERHGGSEQVPVVRFDPARPESLIPSLAPLHPRFLGIVLRPDEAGRDVVGGIHRATRALDKDPYGDVRWGLITGPDAEGAMTLATHTAPLTMRSAAGTADFPMQLFPNHWWWSEEAPHDFTMHRVDAPAAPRLDATNIGPAVAERVNAGPIDLFLSSGHATERGLELGFRKPAGRIGPKDGRIVVECADGTALPVHNPSPKAWIGVGNCLIGNVNGPEAAACRLIADFGVRAHVGYVVVTWYGRGGWGTLAWFTDHPGEHTLNEAWFLNNQTIIDELSRRFPDFIDATFEGWSQDDPNRFAAEVAKRAGERRVDPKDLHDLTGLLWDRDAVVYLGDPTWDARVARQGGGCPAAISADHDELRIDLRCESAARGVPPAFFLPYRLEDLELVDSGELDPLLADDFVILRRGNQLKAGESATIHARRRGASQANRAISHLR